MNTKRRTRKKLNRLNKINQKLTRLVVFRSNKQIYAQLVDDNKNKVVAGSSSLKIKDVKTRIDAAKKVGENIAELAKKNKVSKVVFDRSGYKYHGQVKAVADGAREKGLKF